MYRPMNNFHYSTGNTPARLSTSATPMTTATRLQPNEEISIKHVISLTETFLDFLRQLEKITFLLADDETKSDAETTEASLTSSADSTWTLPDVPTWAELEAMYDDPFAGYETLSTISMPGYELVPTLADVPQGSQSNESHNAGYRLICSLRSVPQESQPDESHDAEYEPISTLTNVPQERQSDTSIYLNGSAGEHQAPPLDRSFYLFQSEPKPKPLPQMRRPNKSRVHVSKKKAAKKENPLKSLLKLFISML